jgi:hypothetical protein
MCGRIADAVARETEEHLLTPSPFRAGRLKIDYLFRTPPSKTPNPEST